MQRIFAADIGGTNARFALFTEYEGNLTLMSAVWAKSADLGNARDVLQAMQQLLQSPFSAGDSLVIALAGPVKGLRGRLTNGRLRVDLDGVAQQYNLACCLLLNDFSAQAFATPTPCGTTAAVVRSGTRSIDESRETRAVLGAGTGLGAAMLVRSSGPGSAGGWLAVPSEAGHAAFAFVGPEEQDYQAFLARELGRDYPTAENVLSGEGLSVLHYYLSGQFFYPPAVGAEALSHETPTLLWYARFWGRFCRQWILTTLCRGGLWIAGGIAAKNALCVTHPVFLQELGLVPDIGGIAASAPIYLVTDGNSGLWGAACAAVEHLSCCVPRAEKSG